MNIGVSRTDGHHSAPGTGSGVKVVVERSIREPCVVHPTRAFSQPCVVNRLKNKLCDLTTKNCGENPLNEKTLLN